MTALVVVGVVAVVVVAAASVAVAACRASRLHTAAQERCGRATVLVACTARVVRRVCLVGIAAAAVVVVVVVVVEMPVDWPLPHLAAMLCRPSCRRFHQPTGRYVRLSLAVLCSRCAKLPWP